MMNVKHSVEVWAGCCVGMACLDPAAADQNWQTLPVSAAGVTSANTETQTALALKIKSDFLSEYSSFFPTENKYGITTLQFKSINCLIQQMVLEQ